MFGDDENETNGRFDTLRNRMDAEIKRQWPKSTVAKSEVTPPSATPPAVTLPRRKGFWQRVDRFLRHPTGSEIVGGLVVVVVVALFGVLLTVVFGG